jgi:hypothetical protein
VLHVLLHVDLIGLNFSSRVLTVDKQLDRGISVLSQRGDELLVDGVLVESIEDDLRDLGVLNRVSSEIHSQVVELATISLNKDKVEALADEEVGERLSDLGASSVDHCCVLNGLDWAGLLTARRQMCRFGSQVLLPVRERFEIAVSLAHATKHSPSEVKSR